MAHTSPADRRPAQFLQAKPAFLPGLGIEHTDCSGVVEFHARDNLGPEDDALHLTLKRTRDRPEPGRLVAAPGQHESPIGAEGSRRHPVVMLKGRADWPPRGDVPKPGCIVPASCQHSLAVGTERHGSNHETMMKDPPRGLSGQGIP